MTDEKKYCFWCGRVKPNQGKWVILDGYYFCSGKCADEYFIS